MHVQWHTFLYIIFFFFSRSIRWFIGGIGEWIVRYKNAHSSSVYAREIIPVDHFFQCINMSKVCTKKGKKKKWHLNLFIYAFYQFFIFKSLMCILMKRMQEKKVLLKMTYQLISILLFHLINIQGKCKNIHLQIGLLKFRIPNTFYITTWRYNKKNLITSNYCARFLRYGIKKINKL